MPWPERRPATPDEGFAVVPGNRNLPALEVDLVNVMCQETVLSQYVDSVKRNYDYALLDCCLLAIDAQLASGSAFVPVQAGYSVDGRNPRLAAEGSNQIIF